MISQDNDFAGAWKCRHWFPSSDDSHEEMSEHDVVAHQVGSELIVQSLANDQVSYLLVRLVLGDDLATGTWHEETLPQGEFGGAIYSGALQLLIRDDKKQLEGKWVGVGQDAGQRKIYTGKWEMQRTSN